MDDVSRFEMSEKSCRKKKKTNSAFGPVFYLDHMIVERRKEASGPKIRQILGLNNHAHLVLLFV